MGELGVRAWTDLESDVRDGVTLLVPVGSVEQHGPHLPLDTDCRVAAAVAVAAAARDGALTVAPTVSYGAAGEHEGFPGTVSIGAEGLRLLLVEYGRSAARWARRLVFVNGHGGNLGALEAAVALLRHEGRDAAWWPCVRPDGAGDAHAGRTETALLLALCPELVRLDAAEPGNRTPLPELLPVLRDRGVRAVSPNGVLGDPTGASAAEGRALLDGLADALVAALRAWAPRADGRL